MKKLLFIFSFLCLSAAQVYAQKTLTLKDCLEIGIENNLSLESKRKDMQKANMEFLRIGQSCYLKSMGLPTIMTI